MPVVIGSKDCFSLAKRNETLTTLLRFVKHVLQHVPANSVRKYINKCVCMCAAVTGGLFRLNLGLGGLVAGTIIGAVLG